MLKENAHLATWSELLIAFLSLVFIIYQTFFYKPNTINGSSSET